MRFLLAALPVGSLLVMACDATGPVLPRPVSLSVMIQPSAASPAGLASDVTVGSGPNSIRITTVEFVLAETELSQAATCSTPPATADNCDELELDPLLIHLPLTASPPVKVLDALVPPGTYTRLQSALHPVEPADQEGEGGGGGSSFMTAHPDWPTGVSVRVSGVFTDGAGATHDFTFTSGVSAEIEMAFASPVTVGATTQNITLTVDVASWFTDATGATIDPTNSANGDAIGANIRRSFRAFEDDNHDGVDDDLEGEQGP